MGTCTNPHIAWQTDTSVHMYTSVTSQARVCPLKVCSSRSRCGVVEEPGRIFLWHMSVSLSLRMHGFFSWRIDSLHVKMTCSIAVTVVASIIVLLLQGFQGLIWLSAGASACINLHFLSIVCPARLPWLSEPQVNSLRLPGAGPQRAHWAASIMGVYSATGTRHQPFSPPHILYLNEPCT